MANQESNSAALRQWMAYVTQKVTVRIAATPKDWPPQGKVYVVPVVDPDFSLGDFTDEAQAIQFCQRNGLAVQAAAS